MNSYADSGFILSLFLPESTSVAAPKSLVVLDQPLPLILLHVAAANLLKSKLFFSFDDRQSKAAAAEKMRLRP